MVGAAASAAAGDIRVAVIAGTRRLQRFEAMAVAMAGVAAMSEIVPLMGAAIPPDMAADMVAVTSRQADSMRGEAITTAIVSGRVLTLVSGLGFRLGMGTMPVVMPTVDADITMAGDIGSRRLAIQILIRLTTVTSSPFH